jgi:hypothetical protein
VFKLGVGGLDEGRGIDNDEGEAVGRREVKGWAGYSASSSRTVSTADLRASQFWLIIIQLEGMGSGHLIKSSIPPPRPIARRSPPRRSRWSHRD